ncbi:MAG: ParA family protein [Pseudomonadales bacterium]|nr:ParA family protein [Pseudomonadales bacterium]
MNAKVIAVFSIKGGVGKTTSAVNLAYYAAKKGQQTLLWDMDPQGATSFYFRIKNKIQGGLQNIADKPKRLEDQIKASDFNRLDVLPADRSYRLMEQLVLKSDNPDRFMERLLKPILDQYDVVIVDCPPNLNEATRSLFNLADLVLVPAIPTVLSIRTLKQLIKYIRTEFKGKVPLKVFFTLVEKSRTMHRDVIETNLKSAAKKKSSNVIPVAIPNHSIVEKMGLKRAPLGEYADDSEPAKAYKKLWSEVRSILYPSK